ncbi:MAG: serine/threonine-protein kinase, partial [Planctomycetota bacterium]
MSDERERTTPNPTGSSSGKSRKRTRRGLTGRKIGPYLVTDEIGRGGMGVVYRAHDSALDRAVAIKVLPGHLGHDEEFMKRFVREARAAAKVDHPGIVQVYQAGRMATETGDGPCFIAMQFVDGQPLSETIRSEGRVDPLRALEITKEVAEALGAAHAAGMIHRDIKSSNILVSEDG